MATTDVTHRFKLPSSLSALSSVGKGRMGLGVAGSAGLFMSADDQRLSQQVQEKHSPDGRQVDVRPILHLVEDIFARANQTAKMGAAMEGKASGEGEANGGAGANLDVNAGVGAGGKVGVGAGVGGNVGVGAGMGGNVGVGAGMGGNVGAGVEAGGNVGPGAGIGGNLGVGAGGGVGGNMGVGGGIGGNVNVGGGIGGGLGGGIRGNVGGGVGGRLGGGIGGNLGGGIGGNLGGSVGGGTEAGAGGMLGASAGGRAGIGGNVGLGGGIGAGLGGSVGAGAGGNFRVDGGVGAGFDTKGDITASFDGSPDLPLTIERVSCEMGCKCLGGADAHEATLSVLDILTHYSWEAKLVITLAGFAANYGEFLLLSQVYSTNPLAQSMALLKQLPTILRDSDDKMNRQMDAINGVINAMLEVTKLVVDFSELPSDYVKPEEPTVKHVYDHFPLAAYWIIRSAVAAATQIALIATMGHEFLPSTTELELSSWSGKLKLVLQFFVTMKKSVEKMIETKQEEEIYNRILRIIFKMVHQDNMTVLKTLIYNKDDVLPLYDGHTKKRVQLDVLLGKTTLLLVTSLDISQDELTVLENIYKESKARPYNIVWLPIVDRSVTWNDSMQSQFENTQSTMPWYSVYHPSIIGNAVIRLFQKDLNFKGKPILVPLDPQGKITSMDALPMMWIWKNDAFPFTSAREDALWRQESWRLELLVDYMDQNILNWSKDDKYIFIYGGEDLDWIRKFTKKTKDVVAAANIKLEMVYVGKSCKKETVRKNNDTIETEKLSHYLKDITSTWFFWTRLDSMLQSMVQLDKVNDENSKVIQEIKKLISYDKNVGGWAILAKGSELVVTVQGTTIYEVLNKFDVWKKRVDDLSGSFHLALLEQINAEGAEPTCCRFEFPTAAGKIPHQMKCPECHSRMQNYITFVCCHEGGLGGMAGKHESTARAFAPVM